MSASECRWRRGGLELAVLGLLALVAAGCERGPTAADFAANDRAVGLMGRFDYDAARREFARLAERHPDWLDVQVNLAIATLNRQQEGDEQAALAIVDDVLQRDPDHLRARYVAGLLELHRGRSEAAAAHLRQVAEADPNDAYAAYYLGQSLWQLGRDEQAARWLGAAIDRDPFLRSAWYARAQALARLGREEQAAALLERFRALERDPRARTAELKYTRMGPKAMAATTAPPAATAPAAPPHGPLFLAPVTVASGIAASGTPDRPVSITSADLDGDGALDLLVAADMTTVLRADGAGGFTLDAEHPLAGIEAVNAALWGDFDNDGRIDVYLCRNGPNALWRQDEGGAWVDVTSATATAAGVRDTADGAFFDADHDGDLDLLLVNAGGADELLNNDGDGAFRPLAQARGLAGPGAGGRRIVVADFDADRDHDLLVLRAQPPHAAHANGLAWRYAPAPGFGALLAADVAGAAAGDLDADGHVEIYTVNGAGAVHRWQADARGDWRPQALGEIAGFPAGSRQVALADVDGDGRAELLATTAAGWVAYGVAEAGLNARFRGDAGGAVQGFTVIPGLDARGPSVAALAAGGRLLLWPPGDGRHGFLALALSGLEDGAQSMRSNASGIGARVTVRAGGRYSVLETLRVGAAPGQSAPVLNVGLGGAPRAEFVIVDWSDGVYQSEVDLAPGRLHRITETQRQLASCPVLFAWNGDGYGFVSDLLGVGGLGFALGPDAYATPRPWEYLLLPAWADRPHAGRYRLKIAEPMEEIAYIDSARLHVYDLPPGWELVVDERAATAAPAPTGRALFYRDAALPARARDGRGRDVTAALRSVDDEAVPVPAPHRRFIGFLTEPQTLTLEFDAPLDAGPGRPVLVMDGWIEYPYSQTMFAAWQAGLAYEPPTVEARGADGAWHTLLEGFGYPAGMPRRAAVPLPPLPPGTRALRITTGLEIYWDRLAIAHAEPAPHHAHAALAPVAARVAKTGFARRTTGPQRRPHYDYARRAPFWDAKYQAGLYTRLGDALELVRATDDALAVIGAGEEVHLEFEAPPAPPDGWRRVLVLEARGWAKDMDLYTRDGATVAPLPARDPASPARAELHTRYNTRWQSGR